MATHRDPLFLAEAGKLKVDISPIDGAEVLRTIDELADSPPELLDRFKRILAEAKGG